MKILLRLVFALCCAVWACSAVNAQIQLPVKREKVTVCPAANNDVRPPTTNGTGCRVVSVWEVDPQNNHIWVFLELPLSAVPDDEPLGLFVSAKAASIAYLNGQIIGENGVPADARSEETPGQMDHVFLLDEDHMKAGMNTIAIRMSSHAGLLDLFSPIHAVFISRYQSPQDATLRAYWPSLLPFGAFALGALYFLTMAVAGRDRLASGLLGTMSALAAVQLLAEVSRGLFAYTYPMHDLRLLVIAGCSAGFGIALAAYVILRFQPGSKWKWFGSAVVASGVMLVLSQGFDQKTSLSLLVPTMVAAAAALSAVKSEKVPASLFAVSLLLFAAVNFVGAGRFLDQYFYYLVAALLVFLFIQQAGALAREARMRQLEEARADRLQYVIDQLNEEETTFDLSIKSTGRIVRVSSGDIAYVSAAGDYAELTMVNGDTHLHGATLTDLEAQLPAFFLRVHRSHLVNSRLIESLERKASGTGELSLSTAHKVPVSRRIMPSIRAALT